MLINNTISFMHVSTAFHMVLIDARLAYVPLSEEGLDYEVVGSVVDEDIRHQ